MAGIKFFVLAASAMSLASCTPASQNCGEFQINDQNRTYLGLWKSSMHDFELSVGGKYYEVCRGSNCSRGKSILASNGKALLLVDFFLSNNLSPNSNPRPNSLYYAAQMDSYPWWHDREESWRKEFVLGEDINLRYSVKLSRSYHEGCCALGQNCANLGNGVFLYQIEASGEIPSKPN